MIRYEQQTRRRESEHLTAVFADRGLAIRLLTVAETTRHVLENTHAAGTLWLQRMQPARSGFNARSRHALENAPAAMRR